MNNLSKKAKSWLENPLVDTIANTIKKFKSSKSYWSVSYLILIFTLREAIAWKYGDIIKKAVTELSEGSSIPWFWEILGFIFESGSWELVALGTVLFVILSLVKVSESEDSSVTIKENYLTVFLLVAILSISLYNTKGNRESQYVDVNGSNNTVILKINIDNNIKELCQEGIEPYEKSIKELTDELAKAKIPEIRKVISRDLAKSRADLASFKNHCN